MMTNESTENIFQQYPLKEKSRKKNRRKKHSLQTSTVPDFKSVDNQLINAASPTPTHDSPDVNHKNNIKKKKKKKKNKEKKNNDKSGNNDILPNEVENLSFHKRNVIEAARLTHYVAPKGIKKGKKKKKKRGSQETRKLPDIHQSACAQYVKGEAPIHTETCKKQYMEGLGLEAAAGNTMMINKKKARKKLKRQEEMQKLKNKQMSVSAIASNPLQSTKKRKSSELHEAGNDPPEISQAEKKPRIYEAKNYPSEKKKRNRKKKTKAKPAEMESIDVTQVQHFETQSETIQNLDSIDCDKSGDADHIHIPDPAEGEFLSTGYEVADDDISVFLEEEEKVIKKLQKRNEDALAMLRSTKNICKKLKEIVPEACLNLPSNPTNANGDAKDNMLNKVFEWPDIGITEFPILYKVMNWIFTKESFVLPDLNIRTNHCFKLARTEQRRSLMRDVPGFRSGRFLTVEDAIILSRLQSLKTALGLDDDGVSKLIMETNNHNKKKGKSRYARVILGAYFGRPLLQYRLAIDIYFRFVTLANVHLRADMLKPENQEKIVAYLRRKRQKGLCNKWNCKCLRDLEMTYLCDTSCLNSILKRTKTFEASGMFNKEESYALFELVIEQRATSDIQQLRSTTVDWGSISRSLNRPANSLRMHYDYAIWTPLARLLTGGFEAEAGKRELCKIILAEEDEKWKRELCEAILEDEAVSERRAIPWKKMHNRFPNVGPYAMLHFIGNCTKGQGKSLTFRERLQVYLEKLPNAKEAKVKSRLDFGMIWDLYSKHGKSNT